MNKPYSREEMEQKQNYEAQRKALKQDAPGKQAHPEREQKASDKTGSRKSDRQG